MNKNKIFHYYILLLILFSLFCKNVYAQTTSEEVTFIYIPGILSVNPEDYEKEAKSLHKYLANKKLGKYRISEDYKISHWGNIPREDLTFEIFKEGLVCANSRNNESACKKTWESNPSLLLNPINRFFLIGDSGSSAQAVFWRNYIHNHIYDVVWYFSNNKNKEKIFEIIQDKISESNNKFILIGNSFGAVIALDFVIEKVIPDNLNSKKFVGVITTGDPNNTVFAPVWNNQLSSEKSQHETFAEYFVNNNKFWISYNHRSDILTTGIAPAITLNNCKGNGFIVSEANHASPLENFILAYKFWDRTNGLLKSHNWCFHKPEQFSDGLLEIFRRNSKI